MIGGTKCIVGVIVHTCEHGNQTVEHYVFFEGDEKVAQETVEALTEAKAEQMPSGFVAGRIYPGTMFLPDKAKAN